MFTAHEIEACMKRVTSNECFAARWAAKEAFFKALGSGLRDGLKWHDVEIQNDALGKPFFKLNGKAAELCEMLITHVSLTHTREYAQAFVIIENRG